MKKQKSTAGKVVKSIASDIKRSNLLNIASRSFDDWKTSWPWILLSVLTDFLFIITTSIIITLIQFTLFEHLEALMTLAGEATGGLTNVFNQTAQVSSGLSGLAANADFQYHLNIIVKYLAIMVLCTFLTWIVFQGLSWFIAYRMSTDKKQRLPFITFCKNFTLQSFPFYLLSVIWIFLSVRLLFAINMSMTPIMGEDFLNFLFVLFICVTWYFGFLSYTITGKYAYSNFKQSFVYGVKRFTKTIQSIAFLLVLFLVIDIILRLSFIRGDPVLLVILGTILFMPAVCFARIMMFRTTQVYWPLKKHSSKKD
jgi:hypothetical protein